MKLKKIISGVLCGVILLLNTNITTYASEVGQEVIAIETSEETTEESVVTEEITEESITTEEVTTEESIEKEKVYEDKLGRIIFRVQDAWDGTYIVNATIENTSDKPIENWAIACEMEQEITNIWNAAIESKKDNKCVIKNVSWNMDIPVGTSQSFGFTVSGHFNGFPDKCMILNNKVQMVEEVEFIYSLNGDWGVGFNASLEIINNSESTIEDWSIEFDYERNITDIWNAEIISHEGNHYIIKNNGSNANILAGNEVLIGFIGNGGKAADEPVNITLTNLQSDISEKPDVDLQKIVDAVLANIEIGFNEKDTCESVTQNIILPADSDIPGAENVIIEWSSSDESVISSNGVINRPYEESLWVTLTAKVSLDGVEASGDFELRAVKSLYDDYSADYVEDYDDYEYLYTFNDGDIEECLQIY